MVFDTIDIDGDEKISLDEAADHLSHKRTGTRRLSKRYIEDPSWFTQLDSNDSGYIEVEEFDADLK